ncbi:MAG TPA: response regulator transcription factor [Anaerolineae bacterium]|nr:response regulator transcription factor [Anaerolineae bacterium]MCB0177978.1 response regulator transcription factor [Anaerolineae bacterium]MCB9103124.1 response regulator transcription factor [Anaerolineales bacterium]HRV93827.1 response regulator transcription factor [Anaerolineae bacterium]
MYALLIAKDADDTAILSTILQRAGLAVTTATNVERAMRSWTDRPADLILISLPTENLLEQVRHVRAETIVPLILIAQNISESHHYELLKQGADLIVVTPYSAKILIAQVGVLMRRSISAPALSLPKLATDDFALNPETRTVEIIDKPPQRLTHLEFRLLYTLMINRGQIIPTETIVERVWGYTGQGDRDLIRGLVSRLRAKVEVDPRNPQFILTNPGIGYSFKGSD